MDFQTIAQFYHMPPHEVYNRRKNKPHKIYDSAGAPLRGQGIDPALGQGDAPPLEPPQQAAEHRILVKPGGWAGWGNGVISHSYVGVAAVTCQELRWLSRTMEGCGSVVDDAGTRS